MNLLVSFLAVALLGADGSPVEGTSVIYQVRVIDVGGLEWRAEAHDRLTPVVRRGGTAVWTAPADLADWLGKKAARTIASPKLKAASGAEAAIRSTSRHEYVADLKRPADGPKGSPRGLTFRPVMDQVEEFVAISARGRWVDQGLIAQVAIEERRLAALHDVTVNQEVRTVERDGIHIGRQSGRIQVPEIVQGQISGEWLIPKAGLLLVSLGTHARSNDDGEPAVIERLAIIEPLPSATEDAALVPASHETLDPARFPWVVGHSLAAGASQLAVGLPNPAGEAVACEIEPPTVGVARMAPVSPSPLADAPQATTELPEPPSRILPTPINHKGEVVELPPLPEDSEAIVAEDESAQPRPAPQSRLRDRQRAETAAKAEPSSSIEPAPEVKAPQRQPFPSAKPAPEMKAPQRQPFPSAEPVPEAKIPVRKTSDASAPRAAAGLVQLALGFGPGGLSLSGRVRLARGDVGTPQAVQALHELAKSWSSEAHRRLTTSIGITGEAHRRTLIQEIAAGLERYAHQGEPTRGPLRVFDLKGRDDQGRIGHVAIFIEADDVGRELLTKAVPVGSLLRVPVLKRENRNNSRAIATIHVDSLLRVPVLKRDPETRRAATEATASEVPTTSPKPPEATDADGSEIDAGKADEPNVWRLSLPEAFRIGLENAKLVRVVARRTSEIPSTMVVSYPPETPPAIARARTQEVAKTIEQAYWSLSLAQSRCSAAALAVKMADEIISRERDRIQGSDVPTPRVAEAEEQLERFRDELNERADGLAVAERRLRQVLGLPRDDGRILTASSKPESEQPLDDWVSCVAQVVATRPDLAEHGAAILDAARHQVRLGTLKRPATGHPKSGTLPEACFPPSFQKTANRLTHSYLAAKSNHEIHQTAQRLKQAALTRLERQKDFFEQGTSSLDRYLDAVNRWTNALSLEAEFLTKYKSSIVELEAAKGALLVRDGITFPERLTETVDAAVNRTSLKAEQAPVGRLAFGISPVPVCPVFQAEPLMIRVPVGRLGVLEARSIESKAKGFPLGPFSWNGLGLFW